LVPVSAGFHRKETRLKTITKVAIPPVTLNVIGFPESEKGSFPSAAADPLRNDVASAVPSARIATMRYRVAWSMTAPNSVINTRIIRNTKVADPIMTPAFGAHRGN